MLVPLVIPRELSGDMCIGLLMTVNIIVLFPVVASDLAVALLLSYKVSLGAAIVGHTTLSLSTSGTFHIVYVRCHFDQVVDEAFRPSVLTQIRGCIHALTDAYLHLTSELQVWAAQDCRSGPSKLMYRTE